MKTLLLLALLALPASAQIFNGPVQASKVTNGNCADGQVPVYANKKQTGCGSSGGGSSYNQAIQLDGVSQTQRAIFNLISGFGISWICVDATTKTNCTAALNTADALSRTTGAAGIDTAVTLSSSSPTTFVGVMDGNPLTDYTDKMRVLFRPNQTCSGSPTLNLNTLGAKNLYADDGVAPAPCTSGRSYPLVYNSGLTATTVNTSGTSVTGTAGAAFTASMVGTKVLIAGVAYIVASYTSGTAITLSTSAGTQTGVTLAVGGWTMPASGSGSGDVTGPGSSVDSTLALANGTTGKIIKYVSTAGTIGQVLTSNGAGVAPSFQAPAGGSGVGQIAGLPAQTTVAMTGSYVNLFTTSVSGLAAGKCIVITAAVRPSNNNSLTLRLVVGSSNFTFGTGGSGEIWRLQDWYLCNDAGSTTSQKLVVNGPMLRTDSNTPFNLMGADTFQGSITGDTTSTFTLSLQGTGSSMNVIPVFWFVRYM